MALKQFPLITFAFVKCSNNKMKMKSKTNSSPILFPRLADCVCLQWLRTVFVRSSFYQSVNVSAVSQCVFSLRLHVPRVSVSLSVDFCLGVWQRRNNSGVHQDSGAENAVPSIYRLQITFLKVSTASLRDRLQLYESDGRMYPDDVRDM